MSQKRIKRFWWLPVWRIEEISSWLTDMAGRGWHLEKVDSFFATFLAGPPSAVRYRCQVGGEGAEERIALFAESDWEFVGTIARQSLEIYRAADPVSPEIHTDPQEQAHTLKPLQGKLYRSAAIALAGFAGQGWILFELFRTPGMLTRALLGEGSFSLVTVMVALGIFSFYQLAGAGKLYGLISLLQNGTALNYHRPWQSEFRKQMIICFATCTLIILTMFVPPLHQTYLAVTNNRHPVVPPGTLPVLRLEEVLPGERFILEAPSPDNHYRRNRSLLIPEQWHLNQSGSHEFQGNLHRVSLSSVGYRARTPDLALFLGERLIKDNWEWNVNYWGLAEQQHPKFDLLWKSSRQQNSQYIIAVRGNWVYRIRYTGQLEPDLVSFLAGK